MNRSGKLQDGSLPTDKLFLVIQLLDAIFLQNLQQRLLQRLCPKRIAVIPGMYTVNAGLVRGGCCVCGFDVIDIGVFLHGLAHKFARPVLALTLKLFIGNVEVSALAVYCTLEDERFAGMRLLQLFDEGEKAFLNLRYGWI